MHVSRCVQYNKEDIKNDKKYNTTNTIIIERMFSEWEVEYRTVLQVQAEEEEATRMAAR